MSEDKPLLSKMSGTNWINMDMVLELGNNHFGTFKLETSSAMYYEHTLNLGNSDRE